MNVVETTRHKVKTAMMVPSRVAGLSKLDCKPAGGFPAGPFKSASFFAGGNDPGGASSMILMAMCKLQDNGDEKSLERLMMISVGNRFSAVSTAENYIEDPNS